MSTQTRYFAWIFSNAFIHWTLSTYLTIKWPWLSYVCYINGVTTETDIAQRNRDFFRMLISGGEL